MRQARSWLLSAAVALFLAVVVPVAGSSVVVIYSPPVADFSPPQNRLIVNLAVSPPLISPNGDGCLEHTTITASFSWPEDGSNHFSSITISSAQGTVFFVSADGPIPVLSAVWDGTHWMSGRPVADGAYLVSVFARVDDPVLGDVQDRASANVSVDRVSPSVVSLFPAEQEASVSVRTGVVDHETKVTYTATTDPQVRAQFSEPLDPWGSSLRVLSEAGLRVSGYDWYDWDSRTLVFQADPPMLGKYRAFAHAQDRACNAADVNWSFIAAALAPYYYY